MKCLCATALAALLAGTALGDGLSQAEMLRRLFLSGDTNYVFVASHRMDWRGHPENSLSGASSSDRARGPSPRRLDACRTLNETSLNSNQKGKSR